MNVYKKCNYLLFTLLLSINCNAGNIIKYGDAVNNNIIAQGFSTDTNPHQAEKKATMDAVSVVSDYFSGIKIEKTEDYKKEYNVIIKENLVIIIKKRTDDSFRIHFKKKNIEKTDNGTKVTIEVSPDISGSVLLMKHSIYLINNGFNSISCEKPISESNCNKIIKNFLKNNNIIKNNKSKLSILLNLESKVTSYRDCKVIAAGKTDFYSGESCVGNLNYQFSVKTLGKGTKKTIKIINGTCQGINLKSAIIRSNYPALIIDNNCKIYSAKKITI